MSERTSNRACPCGEPHEDLERLIEVIHPDPLVAITTRHGTWRVPRIYVAAHGFRENFLADLAEHFGWEKVA